MTYTQDLFDRIIKLNDQGIPLTVIANRLELKYGSLKVMLHKYKKGEWQGRADKLAADRGRMEELVSQGMSVSDMAKLMGLSIQNMSIRLKNAGLDKEMRDELRSLH